MTKADIAHIRDHFPKKDGLEKPLCEAPFPHNLGGVELMRKKKLILPDSGVARISESEYRIYVDINE